MVGLSFQELILQCYHVQVGVGTSLLQAEMVKDGYKSIVNVDYSSNAIKHMQKLHGRIPQLSYHEADCR
jgi:hypothetical protein